MYMYIIPTDLPLPFSKGHGSIKSAVDKVPEVEVVLKDVQQCSELREHQYLRAEEKWDVE